MCSIKIFIYLCFHRKRRLYTSKAKGKKRKYILLYNLLKSIFAFFYGFYVEIEAAMPITLNYCRSIPVYFVNAHKVWIIYVVLRIRVLLSSTYRFILYKYFLRNPLSLSLCILHMRLFIGSVLNKYIIV